MTVIVSLILPSTRRAPHAPRLLFAHLAEAARDSPMATLNVGQAAAVATFLRERPRDDPDKQKLTMALKGGIPLLCRTGQSYHVMYPRARWVFCCALCHASHAQGHLPCLRQIDDNVRALNDFDLL